jgi:hypothetical protein
MTPSTNRRLTRRRGCDVSHEQGRLSFPLRGLARRQDERYSCRLALAEPETAREILDAWFAAQSRDPHEGGERGGLADLDERREDHVRLPGD